MKKILLCFFIQLRGVFLKISYLCGRHPKVLSIKDSLSYILKHRISISRYGDGEILLMEGYPIGFQKEDAALATRLREIARNPIPQHRVCIPDVFPASHLTIKNPENSGRIFIPGKRTDPFQQIFPVRPLSKHADQQILRTSERQDGNSAIHQPLAPDFP